MRPRYQDITELQKPNTYINHDYSPTYPSLILSLYHLSILNSENAHSLTLK